MPHSINGVRRVRSLLRTLMLILWGMAVMMTGACGEFTLSDGATASTVFKDEKVRRLAQAGERGDVEAMGRAIHDGADVNYVGEDTVTPLAWVLFAGNKTGLLKLLQAGANPNYIGLHDYSVTSTAAGMEDPEFLKLVLEHGGNPNIIGPDGNPALHIAIKYQRWENLRILLDHGADINGQHPLGGETPAIYAAGFGQYEQVLYLLERGADYTLRTNADISLAERMVMYPTGDPVSKNKVKQFLEARGVRFNETKEQILHRHLEEDCRSGKGLATLCEKLK